MALTMYQDPVHPPVGEIKSGKRAGALLAQVSRTPTTHFRSKLEQPDKLDVPIGFQYFPADRVLSTT